MTANGHLQSIFEHTDSLPAFVEQADRNSITTKEQARFLINHIWEKDIPLDRAVSILQAERDRLDEYHDISVAETSRAPRYMDLADLELVSGHEFEHILAEILARIEGSTEVTQSSGDQGVDVVWFREAETVGIQAKAYDPDNPVGNSAVQEIYTGIEVLQSDYAIDTPAVVTTSRYTDATREAATNSDVELYDRSDLSDWLARAELDAKTMGNVLDDA